MFSKFCSLIFLFGCIQIIFGQPDLLTCDYGSSYICSLTIFNSGTGLFTDIGGSHVEGREDTDVTEVTATPMSNSATIPSVICGKFANIAKTTFIGIGLETIDKSAFRNCRLIKQINLSDNEISNIEDLAFSRNGELQRLTLAQNSLTSLPSNVFASLTALRQLDLSSNQIVTLENDWFANLGSLQFLYLNNNQLIELPVGVFAPLTTLANLNLGTNQIEVLSSESFKTLPNLALMDVRNNRINAIDERFLDDTGIATLSMDGNDCASDDFIDSSPEKESMRFELTTCFENFNSILTTTESTTVETTSDSTTEESDSTSDSTTEEITSDSTTEDTTTDDTTEETTPDSASGIMIGKVILIIALSMRILLN